MGEKISKEIEDFGGEKKEGKFEFTIQSGARQ